MGLDMRKRVLEVFDQVRLKHSSKMKKIFMKGAQNRRCTSSMCEHNHYTKFEYKGMKTFGVTEYAN